MSTTPIASDDKLRPADAPDDSALQRTALHDLHLHHGARMVGFAGWSMPLQYPSGIMKEHLHCRAGAALFDVSHMGQIEIRGGHVAEQLEQLVPADVVNLPEGKSRYTVLTDDKAGILDDLIITNAGDHFYLVVNASMREQDLAHLTQALHDVTMTESRDRALVALQGPSAVSVLEALSPAVSDLRFMESALVVMQGIDCRVSRLGYTGEDGFEISVNNDSVIALCELLLAHDECLMAGLGARDSLRLEAGLCLYGNDIDRTTTPVEAGLTWSIPQRRREQGGFPGHSLISQQLRDGVSRKLVGIRPTGRVPARQNTPVCDLSGEQIGSVTSGCFGPSAGAPVAMGYVQHSMSADGTRIMLSIRGKQHEAEVCALPFIAHRYHR